MTTNIYKDQMQRAELFGKPVLHTRHIIPRETVPDGWYCYNLCGSECQPNQPVHLVDHSWLRVGTVLSPAPLKRASTESRRVKDFILSGEMMNLEDFCREQNLVCPHDPRKYILRPASPEEAGLFYSQTEQEQDVQLGVVGHLRMDFGGGRLHHSWWPHNDDRFNTPEFKAVLQEFVDELRVKGPLKDQAAMTSWCCRYTDGKIADRHYGFIAETADYRFCLRCIPERGDYSYLYCYDLNQQRMAMAEKEQQYGLTESGLRKLKDTADPSFPHSYNWYVIEACNTAYAEFADGLSLDEAIQRYTASEHDDKRLGVTKDDIAAVDLAIRHDGREWVSEDWTKSESFAQDPTVANAVTRIRQLLEDQTPNQGMTMGGMV